MTKHAMTRNATTHWPEKVSDELRRQVNEAGKPAPALALQAAARIEELEARQTPFEKVGEFHRTFGHPVNEAPVVPEDARIRLRLSLIGEEFGELIEAVTGETQQAKLVRQLAENLLDQISKLEGDDFDVDLIETADALTDITVVTNGSGHEFGLNLDATGDEVHSSNMSKLGQDGKPIYDERGKIMKGPNYFKPNLAKVLGLAGAKG